MNNYVKGNQVIYRGDLYIVEDVYMYYSKIVLNLKSVAEPEKWITGPIDEVDPYPLHIRTRYIYMGTKDHPGVEHFIDSPIQPMIGYTIKINQGLYRVIEVTIDLDRKPDEDRHFSAYIELLSQ